MDHDINQIPSKKRKIIVVNADFGMGGISKSAIEWMDLVDYNKYEITLYIRRNDAVELLPMVNENVNIITIESELKKGIYGNSISDKIVKFVCELLKKFGKKHTAKQLYRWYKYPRQRKIEGQALAGKHFDTAIAYSTADDIPVFVLEQIKASKKYLFIHQSTEFSRENQKTLELYDGVIAVSDNLCEKLKKEFSKRKINFVSLPNYVSHTKLACMADVIENPFCDKCLKLATCGRLVNVKGYDILLDAAEKLKIKNIKFVWYWIGDGSERKHMEKGIEEKRLEQQVIILGEKKNPYPFIKGCDIYVQPSKAEASPLTIFEALSLGKPVISTKTVGGKYILSKFKCGKLVDISSDDIVKNIIEFSENSNLLESELKKVETIDWEKEELEYINNWNKLLSGEI